MLRLVGFTSAPVISALAPFILLPVISRIVGADGWANFSAGQSIGVLGMVAVMFGWGILGPVRVARSSTDRERAIILHDSLRSRLALACIALPAAGAAAYLISGTSYRAETVAIAVAMAAGGLTPAWFCIGRGDARGLMIFDAAPKVVAAILSLPFLLVWGNVLSYPIFLFALTVPAYAVHAWLYAHSRWRDGQTPGRLAAVLRQLAGTAAIDATGNAYGSTSIPIATAGLNSVDASAFASADRAYRIGTLLVVAVGNALQAWTLDPEAADARARQRFAVLVHMLVGLVGGAAIAMLGPWATAVVFGADVAAAPIPSALFGIAFVCISTATPLIRNLLIPAGRISVVLGSTVVAAVIGVTIMILGALSRSAEVVALGVVSSETSALLVLVVPAVMAYRRLGGAQTRE